MPETGTSRIPPPEPNVCDYGYGTYWSYSLGDWVSYNGHDGIDYGISYRPLYAAANADQVIYAGWYDPQNHKANVGIYVKLHHPNGYYTTYGHMSAVAVQSCTTPGLCQSLARGSARHQRKHRQLDRTAPALRRQGQRRAFPGPLRLDRLGHRPARVWTGNLALDAVPIPRLLRGKDPAQRTRAGISARGRDRHRGG